MASRSPDQGSRPHARRATHRRAWQLADSAFPTGGFAHSFGLEAAAQAGEIRGSEGLLRFTRGALWQAGYGALPLCRAAWQELEALPIADARAESFLVSHVANRASRTQGRALLGTCARIFPAEVAAVQAQAAGLKLHLAPLWGAALRALGLSLDEAQRLLLWSTARGVLSAAVRTGLCGTHEGQQLLAALGPLLDEVQLSCSALPLEALAQPSPIADLLQGG